MAEEEKKNFWKDWAKQKQIAIGFILLGILFGIYIFIFLSYNVLAVKGIPELLPEEETAFFAQFNLRNSQIGELQKARIENALESWVKENFAISFKKALPAHSAGLIGIAYLSPIINGNSLMPVLIIESNQQNPLPEDFIRKNKESLEIAQVNNFYVISRLQQSEVAVVLSNESLASSYSFLQTIKEVPPDAFSYFYIQPSQAKELLRNYYYDFEKFQTLGGFLIAAEKGILISANGITDDYSETKEFYSGNLLSFFPEKPELLFGGKTGGSQPQSGLSDLINIWLSDSGFDNLHSREILNSIADSEYGLAFYKNQPVKLLNKLLFVSEWGDDRKFAEAYKNLEKILPRILSMLLPEVREVTLADGTKGRELVADEGSIERSEEEISRGKILIFKKRREPLEFALAVIDHRLFFATDAELIKKALSLQLNSFKKSSAYKNAVSEVMRGIDEIAFINAQKSHLPLFKEIAASVRYEDKAGRIFVFLGD